MRTEWLHADECCMKIILLVITGNFLSGSFRFVGALKSICFCIPSGFAVTSLSIVYLRTPERFPFLHGNFSQPFLFSLFLPSCGFYARLMFTMVRPGFPEAWGAAPALACSGCRWRTMPRGWGKAEDQRVLHIFRPLQR